MKNFRSIIILIMVLALLVSFTACAKSGTDASDPTDGTEHYIAGIYTEPTDSHDHGEEATTPGNEASDEATQPSEPEVVPTEESKPSNNQGNGSTNTGSTTPSNNGSGTGSNNSGSNNTGSTGSNNSGSSNNNSGNTGNSGSTANPQPTEPTPSNPQPTTPSHTHSYTKVVTKPTCTSDGYTTYTCSCGDTYKADTTKATGHSYSVSSKVDPTCTAEGKATYKCANCSDTYTETLSKAPHDWEHHHTDEVGHWGERTLICTCGWTCTESEARAAGYNLGQYYTLFHVKPSEEPWEHSYDTTAPWVVDSPAKDWWTCRNCGSETTSKP